MAQSPSKQVLHLDKITHARISKLDKSKTMVIATLSPIEVHGPHLPLGQDMFEAFALAEAAADRLSEKMPDWTFLLTPKIPVATDCVPQLGSVNFPANLVREVAYYALEPFAKEGFARLAYTSFHGGPRHVCALELAAEQLTEKYDVPTASIFSMVLSRIVEGNVFFEGIENVPDRTITVDDLKKDHHAGFVETCLGLHLWPELIDDGWENLPGSVAEVPDDMATNDSFLYGYEGKPRFSDQFKRHLGTASSIYRSIKHFNDHTYFGYPGMASEEQGIALFDHLTNICMETVTEFIERGTQMEVHSPLWKYRKILLNPTINKVANDWLKLYNG